MERHDRPQSYPANKPTFNTAPNLTYDIRLSTIPSNHHSRTTTNLEPSKMALKRSAHHDISSAHRASSSSPNHHKKPKFDHRNPSTLAPAAPDQDAILDLDEIGRGGQQTKRNAVKLDGYESDSSNENFEVRAAERAKGGGKRPTESKDEEENDMFADIEEEEHADGDEDEELAAEGKRRKKEVRFLDAEEIEGQVGSSTGGGHVSADFALRPEDGTRRRKEAQESEEEDSDSSEGETGDVQRDAVGSDVDEELGAGAKKKHAPRLDGFNMRNEAEEGRFDASGNFVRNAKDPFEVHDSWLEGNSSRASMRKAAKAEEERERERRERDIKDDAVSTGELLAALMRRMEPDETVLEALQRLGRGAEKKKKKSVKKNKRQNEMDVDDADSAVNGSADPAENQRKEQVEAITAAADQLLTRGQVEIYEAERALLERQYRRETGETWKDPEPDNADANGDSNMNTDKEWQYRWADARDGGQIHGPYDGTTMKSWVDAGYFGDGVEFRQVGLDEWSRSAIFI